MSEGLSRDMSSTADRVALHAARIGGRLEQAVFARNGADSSEGPVPDHLDVVAALTQLADYPVPEPRLHLDLARLALARKEGAREVVRVEVRGIDRRLQVEPAVDV